ncbi:hypothetical protein EF847_15605 [Actinobacteria bacterium YIM 96077]|uniref:WXG100 family type VII secretion target n=2 Tax=Phytoactinopolyspora halophila TaxID=1981511 RepID=A0A329QTC4_9ACTN|nr:hypothetical protein EF847_15605 [Actinobacteria bacterium YIM 96077]RAW15547.1 hypothetical protein DPM12_07735 [Phytoactinopolyspora halophila]
MADPAQMVPNPMKSALEQVLTSVNRAVDDIAGITAAADAIGAGPAWTGSAAREVYDHSLAPAARDLEAGRSSIADDVEKALLGMDDLVPEDVAETMRADLSLR